MPFGTVPNGTAARVGVSATAGGTVVLVGGLQGYEYGGEATTTDESFHNDFPSITTVGEPTRDGTYSGRYAGGDSGLAIVKAAFETGDIIFASFLPDGTDGEELPVRVSRFRVTSGGSDQAPQYQFSLVQADDPTDVAGGLF